MQRSRIIFILLSLIGFLSAPAHAAYFGKNKVRAHELDWSVLETAHFEIHYYAGEEAAANAAAEMAEGAYDRLSKTLNHEIVRKVPVILYASHSDFQETNITPEIIDAGTGGITEFVRRRVFLPFTGSYADLRHVLTHELVHAFQIDILFGGAGGPRLNPFSLNVPLWMLEGMAEYLSLGGVDSQTEMWLSDACSSGRLVSIPELGRVHDIRVYRHGQAIWDAIAREHGVQSCGAVLRAIVSERSADKGVRKALGVSLEDLSDGWVSETQREYLALIAERRSASKYGRLVAGDNPRETLALSPAISPDGRRFAFFSNRDLSLGLYVGDLESGKVHRIVEGASSGNLEELRLFHSSIAWSPDGRTIAFTAKGVGNEALVFYDTETRRIDRRVIAGLSEVRSPAYSPDGTRLALVGVQAGRSDLYLYEPATGRVDRLTDDLFAERSPAFSPDGARIAFTTDGAGTDANGEPHFGPDRLALLDLTTREVEALPSVGAHAASPVWDDGGKAIVFTADPQGLPDIFIMRLATREILQATHITTGVAGLLPTSTCLSLSPDGRRLLFTALDHGAFGIYLAEDIQAEATPFEQPLGLAESTPKAPAQDTAPVTPRERQAAPDTTQQSLDGSDWRSDYDPDIYDEDTIYASAKSAPRGDPPEAPAAQDTIAVAAATPSLTPLSPPTFAPTRHAYKAHFAPDLAAGGGSISTSGIGFGQSVVTLSDLLGNQRITIGVGVYGSLKNSDISLGYEDLRGRNEVSYRIFSHQSRYRGGANRVFLTNTSEFLAGGEIEVRRPISRFTRYETSLTAGVLNEAYRTRSYVSSETGEVGDPGEIHRFASAGLALVNDTVLWGRTGPIRGRRLRLSTDLTMGDIRTVAFRADLRRYWRVTNDVVLAGRLMGGYRTGHLADSFHLGETTLVHGLRYGELIGTRMAVANFEARFPFIRTLAIGFPTRIRIDEIGGAIFADAGSAWTHGFTNGGTDEDRAVSSGNLLGAYGAGIRANLSFFILKLDVAQRTNFSALIGKPIVIASFGGEF